ncbi:MAG: DUF4405 domain-containing protein [Acidobacteriota bacterium]|jgi:hypothetical protein
MSFRRIVSLVLFIMIFLMLVTSAILYISPQGRVAYWSGWTLAGLSRDQWINLHVNLGILFLLGGAVHLWYNWRAVVLYLKNRSRRLVVLTGEFSVALVGTIVLLVGTQLALAPFDWVPAGSEVFKDAAAERYGEPPYGHAELSTLATFAKRVELDVDVATARMIAAGYRVDGPDATVEQIAEANGVTPQALYAVMQPPADPAAGPQPMPLLPRAGTGRRVLSELCEEYGFTAEHVVALLADSGIEAHPDATLKDIADTAGTSPDEVYEAIRVGMSVSR